MGVEVDLFAEIGLVISSHVMVDQRNRDNEGDVALTILLDDFK